MVGRAAMMPFVFLTLLLGCTAYAFVRGGAPERMGAAFLLLAVIASAVTLSLSRERYLRPEVATMWVDIALAAAFLVLALRAQRYWPIWAAAVHVDLVATHLVMFSPDTQAWSYWAMHALWSYPAPLLVAAGTFRHRRRLEAFGEDPAWTRGMA